MGLLNHPNICKLFEVLETKTTLHMVLEYAPGGDLLDHIVSKGHLREDNARAVATQLASALVSTINARHIATQEMFHIET